MLQNSDDARLVSLCLKGEPRAFNKLMDRYKRQIFTLILRMVRNRDDAEDLAQETFIKAYRHLSAYDAKYPFITWLFKIAHNTTIDFLRAHRTELLSIDDEDSPVEDECADQSFLESIDTLSDGPMINKALDTLPPQYREILILRHQQELSYQEISQALELPEGTVKIRLFRARNLLKNKLLNMGFVR